MKRKFESLSTRARGVLLAVLLLAAAAAIFFLARASASGRTAPAESEAPPPETTAPPSEKPEARAARRLLDGMTTREKICQLLILQPEFIPGADGDVKTLSPAMQDTLRAYPIPWRGTSNLCFTPLPESRKFIEIRNGRGDLVLREPYTKTTHCIDADRVRTKMAPGVYRFRAGSSGKMQKFLIVY